MSELGYDNLTPLILIERHNRNVTPSFDRRLQMDGLMCLTPKELISHNGD